MNKIFKRFNNLPIQTQSDVCEMLLFNMIGFYNKSELKLMSLWLEEINPLIYVLNVNGVYKGLETFSDDTKKIENKVTQYLLFAASEINTL
jgi:hypothetical protein